MIKKRRTLFLFLSLIFSIFAPDIDLNEEEPRKDLTLKSASIGGSIHSLSPLNQSGSVSLGLDGEKESGLKPPMFCPARHWKGVRSFNVWSQVECGGVVVGTSRPLPGYLITPVLRVLRTLCHPLQQSRFMRGG